MLKSATVCMMLDSLALQWHATAIDLYAATRPQTFHHAVTNRNYRGVVIYILVADWVRI